MEPAARLKALLRRLLRAALHPVASCCYLLLAILPLLLACGYNHPSNDDYDNVIWKSFWGYQHHIYFKFGGRYFANLVVSIDPIRWRSLSGYRLVSALMIICFAVTYTVTICRLLGRFTAQPLRNRLFAGVATTVIIFNGVVSLAESFYWYTGSVTYTLPVLLLCWASWIGLRLDAGPDRVPVWAGALQALLLIAIVGCNETAIPSTGLLCLFLMLHYRGTRPKLSRWYGLLSLIWLAAAAAAILAPGNFVRQAGEPRNLMISMPTWLFVSKNLFLEWISEPVFMAFTAGFVVLMMRHPVKLRMRTFPAFIVSLAIIACMMFPVFWAQLRMPPFRVRNLCYMVFVPLWLLTLTAAAKALSEFAAAQPGIWHYLRSTLTIAVSLVLLHWFRVEILRASSNYVLVAKDFGKGTFKAYDAEHRARYDIIRQSGDTVYLPRLRNKQGNVVHFADLGGNPDVFPNPSVARYWGKKRIVLLPPDSATH
jgi:hypothetical protein